MVLALSGCNTAEQDAARAAEHTRIINADIAAHEEAQRKQYCADLGTPEGTPNYNECRFKLNELMATRAKMGIPVNEAWWERQKLSGQ